MKKKVLLISAVVIATIYVFTYFGGFTTGKSLDVNEFKAYAKSVDEISIPQEFNIIALGEATHGNKEFQQLKLEVFKKLVEEHRVHSFALEGDFGGCEEVNQYIHGGEGTLKEIVQKIGFQIYKTEEMMQLIEYIREYNDDAEEEQLNFYGFDMQRIRYSFDALKKECIAEGVNLSFLDNFIIDGQWNQNYSYAEKKDLLMKLKKTLELKEFNGDLIHFVDVLLQNVEVLHRKDTDGSLLRDQYMAENVSWILQKEQQRGNDCIFIRGIMNMLQNGEVMTLWGNCYQINIDIM